MGKKKLRDLAHGVNAVRSKALYNEYKALLMNAITIEGVPATIEHFIKNTLIEQNAVGYDAITGHWSLVYGEGLNDYWLPTLLTFVYPNKSSYQRNAYYTPDINGAYMIKGLPADISFSKIINDTVEVISACDKSILQNLLATRTPFIGVVKDEDTRLSLEMAIEQKEDGKPVIIVSPDIADGLKGVVLDTPFIVDKLYTFKVAIRDALFNKLGIMSANINKRERVQVGEVNATVGQCVDYIYMLIDNFNKQCTQYGLPFKMTLNGALEELYTEDIDNV